MNRRTRGLVLAIWMSVMALPAGAIQATPPAHDGMIHSAVFNPDGTAPSPGPTNPGQPVD